jgi:hypothetical protein
LSRATSYDEASIIHLALCVGGKQAEEQEWPDEDEEEDADFGLGAASDDGRERYTGTLWANSQGTNAGTGRTMQRVCTGTLVHYEHTVRLSSHGNQGNTS